MLDMGFLPPLKKIIAKLPAERQSLCFSATMPKEIADLVQQLLRDPHRIDIAPPSTTAKSVEQQVLQVDQSGKRDLLQQILKQGDACRVLVFTRTKRRADVVARHLKQADIEADAIHGDKTQSARTRALDRFKSGRIHVLVATDVAARGIDVEGISHVINYDLPHDPESYVHRIGRTGRASAVGKAITFCDASERGQLRAIERLIGIDLLPREERRSGDHPPRLAQGRRPVRGQRSRSGNGGGYGQRSGYVKGNGSVQNGAGDSDGRPRKRRFKSAGHPHGRPGRPQPAQHGEFGVGVGEGRSAAGHGGGRHQRHR
jgi:ATP-dependent RNA helicase RhlE